MKNCVWSVLALLLAFLCACGDAKAPTVADLQDGSAYISAECLYMSVDRGPQPHDSKMYYTVEGDTFVSTIRWWREERGRDDLGDRSWQPLPWDEAICRTKPWYLALEARYGLPPAVWQYIPLTVSRYLLTADGMLFLWDGDDLYRLEQTDNVTAARWAYLDGVDPDHLPVELDIDGDVDQIWLTCDDGSLHGVFYYEGEDRFDHKLTLPDEKNITYWSPQNEDGTVAEAAVIRFSLLRGDSMFLDEEDIFHTGTITLKRIGNKYRQVHLDGALPGGVSLTVLDPAGKPLLKAGGTAQ